MYMYLPLLKTLIGHTYVICGYTALKFWMLLSKPFSSLSVKNWFFLRNLFSDLVKKKKTRIFSPKNLNFHKNKNFSLEEHALIE